ncbi:MAG: hypothetical protein LQ344_001007 [Seirophora lacunosa]|nr:MAG: hypothetical protein LQ344_001007 [Seirophora lacunosa]
MESIHGVDVNSSSKDKAAVTSPSTNASDTAWNDKPNGVHGEQGNHATSPPQSHHLLHMPSLHPRSNSEKSTPNSPSPAKSPKEPKSPSLGRRNSWITSISSKFSSNSNPPTTAPAPNQNAGAKPAQTLSVEQSNPFGAAVSPGAKDIKKPDITSPPAQPPTPKSGHPGFLQSALRRLSSSSGASMGKVGGSGGVCARKVMNVDPYRDRCEIPDLEPAKLKRVAFCVDVEIAAPAKYPEEDVEEPEPEPESAPQPRRPSLTQLEHQIEAKRKRDQKLKKSEGEALKNPQAVADDKESVRVVQATGEKLDKVVSPPETPANGSQQALSRKREKKKRSEEERKERKERKKAQALANGTKPIELTRQDSSSSNNASPSTGNSPPNEASPLNGDNAPKSTDRPTTDPLRIYRRCCQLRETPILKRITEQISLPSACPIATPGIITCLDLSGYWMQLPDIVTLGDYLAVVPVKKLILEDCGLGDEAVRVVLAGLLATKTPEQAKHNRKLAKKCHRASNSKQEQVGVIEKLSLKNNAKIGPEGWRHVSFFINMSRSLKAIDLSGIPLAQPSPTGSSSTDTKTGPQSAWDIPTLLQKSIAERLAGSCLEELVMGECALDANTIEMIVEAVVRCRVRRLGLAHNNMTRQGLQHVIRYVQQNDCEGLDLGGNDLREHLYMLADVLDQRQPLYALSLADCNLSPASLSALLPALVRLPNFRFIDLSHNRDLFSGSQNALGLLRKYLPQLPIIKRVHLMDVAMTSEHAVALAEILPEIKTLAHLNILENHLISGLASAEDEASQEEACALYASLMVAVRVSSTIVCIDVDVPTEDSSEVIKALAKQVVAYSLRNMERLPLTEGSETAVADLADPHSGEKPVTVPDCLLHLVGHSDDVPENLDHDEPAPDDDYIVGGTGVVKALGICLNRAKDQRRSSRDMSPASVARTDSGTVTPTRRALQEQAVTKGKAKEMSLNLLSSARRIRARLQPALVREAQAGYSSMAYKRLQYLDSTLDRMIQRFENQYPETRLINTTPFGETLRLHQQAPSTDDEAIPPEHTLSPTTTQPYKYPVFDDTSTTALKPALARAPSEHSLASRQAAEEGHMHRFGQRMRREVLPPDMLDYAHGTTGEEAEPEYVRELRSRLEAIGGEEIRRRVQELGTEGAMKELGATKEALVELERRGGVVGEKADVIERLVAGGGR